MCDCCDGGGMIGGAGGPVYNTPYNTIGMGDVVAPRSRCAGSGDLFGQMTKKKNIKSVKSNKKNNDESGFISSNPGGCFGQPDLPLYVPIK